MFQGREATLSATGGGVSLPGFTDASGQVWYTVPDYGPVAWSVERITTYARDVRDLHRADKPVLTLRRVWGVLPVPVVRSRRCKVCLSRWECRHVRWAACWLARIEAGVDARSGRRDGPVVR